MKKYEEENKKKNDMKRNKMGALALLLALAAALAACGGGGEGASPDTTVQPLEAAEPLSEERFREIVADHGLTTQENNGQFMGMEMGVNIMTESLEDSGLFLAYQRFPDQENAEEAVPQAMMVLEELPTVYEESSESRDVIVIYDGDSDSLECYIFDGVLVIGIVGNLADSDEVFACFQETGYAGNLSKADWDGALAELS